MAANVRYLISGATYNGDGTTSAEAASAGAAGAWNDLTILTTGATPAYGTLPADTVVHIRSQTRPSNGALTFTLSASQTWGNANATATAPIIFAFDDGTVWNGINGTVLIETVSASWIVTTRGYNILMHKDASGGKLVFENRHAACVDQPTISLGAGSHLVNATIDYTKVTHTANGPRGITGSGSASCYLQNVTIKVGARASSSLVLGGSFGSLYADGIYIELTALNPFVSSGGHIFLQGTDGGRIVINGGAVYGTGATSAVRIFSFTPHNNSGGYIVSGFTWPYDMQTTTAISASTNFDQRFEALGCDGVSGSPRQMGAIKIQRAGAVDSRNDGNHPYLNATFNDSAATGWSWRCVPDRASVNSILDARCFSVFSDTSTPATRVITLELQVRTSFLRAGGGTVDKGNTWMVVTYIDNATGAVRIATTYNPASADELDLSTASWSATTWGAIALTKKKLTLTTPTAVKPDTLIGVSFNTAARGASASDVIFVCPDPVIT